MKKKYIMIAILLILICVCLNWVSSSRDQQGSADKAASISDASKEIGKDVQILIEESTEIKEMPQIGRFSKYQLQTATAPNSDSVQKIQPHPDYAWYTSPTSKGSIKNASNEVIFQASEEMPFVQLKSYPESTKIVVISTNRRAYLVDTKSKQRHALPETAPIVNAKGFESWNWISKDQLIAECHVMKNAGEPITEYCCTLHKVDRTVLYVYDCSANTLIDIELPTDLNNRAFQLGAITVDGLIELLGVGVSDEEPMRIGWFSISR